MDKRYCLDTNVFIEPWNKYYAINRCPEYWEIIDALGKRGRVFCTHEVRREVDKVDDELKAWLAARPYLVKDVTVEIQEYLRQILTKFPRLVDTSKDRSMADPWVIAHAMAEKAVVVTKEINTPNGSKKIKFPDVCSAFGVSWMNDFQFLDEVGIKFSAKIEQG